MYQPLVTSPFCALRPPAALVCQEGRGGEDGGRKGKREACTSSSVRRQMNEQESDGDDEVSGLQQAGGDHCQDGAEEKPGESRELEQLAGKRLVGPRDPD